MTEFELWAVSELMEGDSDPLAFRKDELGRYKDGPLHLACRAWEAALNRAIEVMPGGSVTDPQWVCDSLRELGGTRGG